jgi:hypothetical protein
MAHARLTDPETSHEAADTVSDVTVLQGNILQLFKIARNRGRFLLTDDDTVEIYGEEREQRGWAPATPQSIRSRRSELVTKGYIVFDGRYGLTVNGRRTRGWKLA